VKPWGRTPVLSKEKIDPIIICGEVLLGSGIFPYWARIYFERRKSDRILSTLLSSVIVCAWNPSTLVCILTTSSLPTSSLVLEDSSLQKWSSPRKKKIYKYQHSWVHPGAKPAGSLIPLLRSSPGTHLLWNLVFTVSLWLPFNSNSQPDIRRKIERWRTRQMQWLTLVIPATPEADIEASPDK
jgi:hypothetical protein